MEVATGKHNHPLIPTLFHFFPHAAKICPSLGQCQEKKSQKRKIFPENTAAGGGVPGKRESGDRGPLFSGVPGGWWWPPARERVEGDKADYVIISI
jgi:hypothetical protein